MLLGQQFCVTAPVLGTSLDATFVQNLDVFATVASASTVAAGDIVTFNSNPFTASTNSLDDVSLVAYVNSSATVVKTNALATNSAGRRIVGVAMEGGTAGVKIRVRVRGAAYAFTLTASSFTFGGGTLCVSSTGTLIDPPAWPATPTNACRIGVAVPLASTATGTAARTLVLFDGLFGLSTYQI